MDAVKGLTLVEVIERLQTGYDDWERSGDTPNELNSVVGDILWDWENNGIR